MCCFYHTPLPFAPDIEVCMFYGFIRNGIELILPFPNNS